MDEVVRMIGKRLVPNPPMPREAIPFRRDQLDALRKARSDLLAERTAAAAEGLKTMIRPDQRRIEDAKRRQQPRS